VLQKTPFSKVKYLNMASGGCSNTKKPVKIVIVTTEYVETDAMSFKSVVQKLTGKHSSDRSVDDDARDGRKAKREKHDVPASENVDDGRSTFFISDSLFNEYDMFLRERMLPNDHFLFE